MSHRIENPNAVQKAFKRSKERESLIRKDVQKANEGPFDKRVYPPKWAFNGDEDKYGNPTKKGEQETDALTDAVKRMLILECSECDEARTENLKNVLLHSCAFETRQFAKTAWKHGWMVETRKVLCSTCRADEEEWRAI